MSYPEHILSLVAVGIGAWLFMPYLFLAGLVWLVSLSLHFSSIFNTPFIPFHLVFFCGLVPILAGRLIEFSTGKENPSTDSWKKKDPYHED